MLLQYDRKNGHNKSAQKTVARQNRGCLTLLNRRAMNLNLKIITFLYLPISSKQVALNGSRTSLDVLALQAWPEVQLPVYSSHLCRTVTSGKQALPCAWPSENSLCTGITLGCGWRQGKSAMQARCSQCCFSSSWCGSSADELLRKKAQTMTTEN